MYLPESNEEILDMVAAHPDRFIAFCNLDPRALTNSPDAPLGDVLRYYRDQGCKGIGEVMPNLYFLLELRKEKRISEEVFQKVARENAIRILGLC